MNRGTVTMEIYCALFCDLCEDMASTYIYRIYNKKPVFLDQRVPL